MKLVRSADLAALVSPVNLSGPLGTPEDLQAHKQILDSTAAGCSVLRASDIAVRTSARRQARAPLGFSHLLGTLTPLPQGRLSPPRHPRR